jgi:predicted Zn finger-like uncharacterized protein
MIVQCPECQTKLKIKDDPSVKAGQRLQVKCRCGQRLQFKKPDDPKQTEIEARRTDEFMKKIFGTTRPGFGGPNGPLF